jgi:UDP-N-acetylglucosamine:LPS N-acetylglucosamine transferase
MLLERDATPAALLEALRTLLLDAGRRTEMASKARSLAKPGALERIAAIVERVAAR